MPKVVEDSASHAKMDSKLTLDESVITHSNDLRRLDYTPPSLICLTSTVQGGDTSHIAELDGGLWASHS